MTRYLLLLALLSAPLQSLHASSAPVATILCYHVVESPADTHFTLSRSTFDRQMAYLAAAGYRVVPLSHVTEYLAGERKSLPSNAVVLTIDDGWRSTYTEFWPITRKYGFPFTAFVYPKFVGQGRYAVTWDQLREMARAGVEIESHAFSHPFLARSRNQYSSSRYAQWLANELIDSKRIIEEQTGRPVRSLAYPYGDFDEAVVAQTRAAGYDAAVTATFGTVRSDHDPYRLNRVVIERRTSFAEFRRLLGAAPLPVDDLTPRPGTDLDSDEPLIEARVSHPDRLTPGSLSMAILGQGRVPFSFDPETGRISTVVRDTRGGAWQDVIVWAHERGTGRRLEATWRVRFPDDRTPGEDVATEGPATPAPAGER